MAIVDGRIRCSSCKEAKELLAFAPSAIARKSGTCKTCKCRDRRDYEARNPEKVRAAFLEYRARKKTHYVEIAKAWRKRNPEKVKGHNLKNNYGIDEHGYNALFQKQGGRCALCPATQGSPNKKSLFVDHCHKTGEIRGLLCRKCNTGIGLIGDTVEAVERAVEYLRGEKKIWQIGA